MIYREPVYLVAARRSAIGRFGGGLKSLSPADLAVAVAEAMLPPGLKAQVDQVILGQVLPAAAGMNVARQVGLRLGLPLATPAFAVNQVCASGLKAVALAADAITLGESAVVLAGGVEVMSRAPYYDTHTRWGRKLGPATLDDSLLVDGLTDPVRGLAMVETAERLATEFSISRLAQDEFAVESQRRASAAREDFAREIVPVTAEGKAVSADEHPRPDTTLAKLAALRPTSRPDGTVTAGNASGLNDGAALLVVAGARSIDTLGLTPRARVVAATTVGCAPERMGLGPVGAIRRLCAETGWDLATVDAVEINEAFAAQVLACAHELALTPAKMNLRGGAIALGHPLGASGARILVTLLHLLEDRQLRRGIAALCVGGGMGLALAIERPDGPSSRP